MGPPPPGGPGRPPTGPGGFGPGGFGPPPRKKSPLVPILLGGGGGLVLLILVIVVIAAAAGNDDEPSASSSAYSYSYSSLPSSSYASYASPSSVFSTSAYPTSSESSSSGTEGGGYGSPEHNKIYKAAPMKGVHCTADLRSDQVPALRRYSKKVMACLDNSWAQVLASAGIEFRKPHYVISASKRPRNPCGSGDVGYVPSAFYCPTNETMYFSIPGTKAAWRGLRGDREYVMDTAPHEYGHHIQSLTGILSAFDERYNDAYPDVAKYTRLNRRMELQPQCFDAMFLGRNPKGMHLDAGTVKWEFAREGDENVPGWKSHPQWRTHGKRRNSGYWANRGWNSGRAGTCNTWTAPGARVA